MTKTGLKDCPSRIFNADETSFALCGRPTKVLAKRGSKSPQFVVVGSGKENITVNACVSADGRLLPPYILYTGQRLMLDYTQGGPLGTRYGVSQRGWMNEVNFVDWFKNLFIPSLPEERPVILILDGHESHVKYEVRQLAIDNGIEIAKLPPHTTHLLQPLDIGVFKPLKDAYDSVAHRFFLAERRYVAKKDFPKLIGQAWKTCAPNTIINGFKKAGIVPLNRDAINVKSLMTSLPFCLPRDTCTSGDSILDMLGENIQDETENVLNRSISSPPLSLPPVISATPSTSLLPSPSPVLSSTPPTTMTPPPPASLLPPGAATPSTSFLPSPSPVLSSTPPTTMTPPPPASLLPPTTPSTSLLPSPQLLQPLDLFPSNPSSSQTQSLLPSTSNSQPSELRNFFLSFLQSQTPKSSRRRNRALSSHGESLTEEEALKRQKEYEDEKKRKEIEKEERKRVREEKREEKKLQEKLKKENKGTNLPGVVQERRRRK